jgi:hypothetical protein
MPDIKTPETSKKALGEIAKTMLENAPTITLGVLTVVTLLTSAKYYPKSLALLIPLFTAASSILIAWYQILKNKVRELRIAIDAVDDALLDNTVTIEEIRDIFFKIRKRAVESQNKLLTERMNHIEQEASKAYSPNDEQKISILCLKAWKNHQIWALIILTIIITYIAEHIKWT